MSLLHLTHTLQGIQSQLIKAKRAKHICLNYVQKKNTSNASRSLNVLTDNCEGQGRPQRGINFSIRSSHFTLRTRSKLINWPPLSSPLCRELFTKLPKANQIFRKLSVVYLL